MVTVDGRTVENTGDFSGGLGAKGPATDLLSGETKVVGDSTPAANDANFTGAKVSESRTGDAGDALPRVSNVC